MDEKNPPQKGWNGGVGEELSVTIVLFVAIIEWETTGLGFFLIEQAAVVVQTTSSEVISSEGVIVEFGDEGELSLRCDDFRLWHDVLWWVDG